MTFVKVTLVVRVLDMDQNIIGAYRKFVKLPFAPTIGMQFKQNSSIHLWETVDGTELDPRVEKIVYNIDDDEMYCLFDIDRLLKSSSWSVIKNPEESHELKQFAVREPALAS